MGMPFNESFLNHDDFAHELTGGMFSEMINDANIDDVADMAEGDVDLVVESTFEPYLDYADRDMSDKQIIRELDMDQDMQELCQDVDQEYVEELMDGHGDPVKEEPGKKQPSSNKPSMTSRIFPGTTHFYLNKCSAKTQGTSRLAPVK